MKRNIPLLLDIAKETVEKGEYHTSTIKLSKKISIPQQSVSRILIKLAKEGLIKRKIHGNGITLSLTEKGFLTLREFYGHLSFIFARKKAISGNVIKGFLEGRYYMGLDGYRKQFKTLFGFIPFKGTLNLEVEGVDIRSFLGQSRPVCIKGFKTKKRDFGGLFAYPCIVEGRIKGVVVVPERTHHKNDIIEVIAKENLRKELKLKNGDIVNLEIA